MGTRRVAQKEEGHWMQMGLCEERESSDDIIRYKVKLVAKGYAQREGINYNEVFSPVVKHSSIRILLALIAQYDYELD